MRASTKRFFKTLSLSAGVSAAFFTSLAMADGSVWKAQKDGKHLYLGGTMHVLSKEDYPLPPVFDQAYKKSDVIYFETDIKAAKDPEVANRLIMPFLMAKEGETLDKVLKPETLEAVEDFLKKRKLSLAMFNQFNPSGLYVVLVGIELANMGMTNAGVDEHFNTLADKDKKRRGQLETIDQQMSFLANIGKDDPDRLILYTLRDLAEMPAMMAQMKQTWRSGDRAKYREVMLEPMLKDYPKIYESLLVERNNNWMPKIEALFETPEIELVLVGALHMVGKDGLLQLLERKGYTIEPFEAGDGAAKE